ncbi:MAG: histidine kinase [Bacteroidales bacterium]|nr:histidine kinase [Bacteroidales bacterium]
MQFYRQHLTLILLLIFNFVSAQEPVYRHFTNQNGLPSSEVYDVIQSEEGYLWFATNFGVVRFDGLNFRVFDKQDGLPENTIFNVQKDPSGRIWFNAFNGKLAYWDGKQIHPYKNNRQLSEYINSTGLTTTIFISYDIQRDGSILFDLYGKGLHRVKEDGSISPEKKENDACFFDLKLIENGRVLFNSPTNNTLLPRLRILNGDSTTIVQHQLCESSLINSMLIRSIHYQNTVYFSYNHQLIQISSTAGEKVYPFDYRISALKIDNQGRLWVGTINGGVFMFDDLTLKSKPVNYLKGNSISNIYFDHEDGIWISSTNNGVFYYPTLNITKFNMDSKLNANRIIDIESDSEGHIWLGLEHGYLLSVDPDQSTQLYQIDQQKEAVISFIKWDDIQKRLLIGTNIDLYYLKNGTIKSHPNTYKTHDKNQMSGFSAIMDIALNKITGDFWLGKYTGISNLTRNGDVTFMSRYETGFDERVETIEIDDRGTIWLGSLHGLWQYKNNSFYHLDSLNQLLGERITAIKAMNDTILLGTRGNGLLVLTKDSLYQYTTANGLSGNSVNSLAISPGLIFAGTNQGVSTIERKALVSKPMIQVITVTNGLTSNEVTSMYLKNNKVYVGTSEGLNIFNLASLVPPKIHFPLVITNMSVKGTSVEIQDSLEIEFEDNAIEIDYFAISFRNKGKITYRHRLIGLNDAWIENKLTSAQFPYLPPGKYVFEVSALNLSGDWNPKPTRLSFVVLKPYWQTWWFISFMIILIGSILWASYILRLRAIRRKNKMLQDIYKYQQEALIGQMNPHFLFNALNTVQRYILENDMIASSRYLSKFAGLMRKTLENSQNKVISIHNEMEALNLYLEVEAARFKNKFGYEVIAEPGFNPFTTVIPVFIIQPLVENAIWHGFMTSKRYGKLKILFVRENDGLLCRVIDNGIGREEAAKLGNNDDNQSLGISIIQKRLNLLNLNEKKKAYIHYIDLKDENGKAAGTKVVVSFPQFFIPAK